MFQGQLADYVEAIGSVRASNTVGSDYDSLETVEYNVRVIDWLNEAPELVEDLKLRPGTSWLKRGLYINGEPLLEALCRTFITNSTRDSLPSGIVNDCRSWRVHRLHLQKSFEVSLSEEFKKTVERFNNACTAATMERLFFSLHIMGSWASLAPARYLGA
jgi:hypothetical protein